MADTQIRKHLLQFLLSAVPFFCICKDQMQLFHPDLFLPDLLCQMLPACPGTSDVVLHRRTHRFMSHKMIRFFLYINISVKICFPVARFPCPLFHHFDHLQCDIPGNQFFIYRLPGRNTDHAGSVGSQRIFYTGNLQKCTRKSDFRSSGGRKHDASLMDRLLQHTSGMRGYLFIVIKYRSVQIQSDHADLRFHMFRLLFSVATVLYPDCLLHSYFPFSPRTSHPHAPSPEYSISISQPRTAICRICAESQSSSVAIPSSPWNAR